MVPELANPASPAAARPTGRRLERVTLAALATVLAVLALAFAYHLLPFVGYRYEADPSDGDMLNALMRGLAGKPIYGDWRSGTITLLYPPLFLGVLGAGHALGVDPIIFFRAANLGFFLLSLALVVVVGSRGEQARLRITPSGVLAGLFVMSAWQQYFWIAPVHPAALLLVLSLLACALLALRPQATTALALLCTGAILAKQSGVALLVGVFIHLAIADRARLRRFCLVTGLALGVALGLGELQSHGQFLRSILFHPHQAFTGAWLSWSNSFTLLGGFYGGRLWLVPLVACGLVAARRSWLLPLAVVFLVDGAAQLYLARSVAGSASYYWFHFALAAILAAHGWQWLMALAATRLRGLGARPSVPALLALLLGLIVLGSDGRELLALPRQDLSRAAELSRRHADVVATLVAANRDRKWIVTRSSLAAVRAGALLDQEYATFAIAWTAPGLVDRAAVRRRVAAGEYGFVQVGPTSLTFDPLADVFAACFAPVARSTLVYMGQPAAATFLRYDGTGTLCQSLAAAR